ncbi:MAG: DUF192 domain-containing protein [Candidatus Diapherotrites archaeon]|nr:DUF192 domain-containing protein [Candidatus Diapherotrites archaeon]
MLRNKTRKLAIAKKVRFADSFFLKFKGLMFEKKERFDYALVFPFGEETRLGASIHMLFVFFPMAAVYLDSGKKVVDIAILKPFILNYTPKKPAKYLIELPEEKAKLVSVGDRLEF